MFLENALSIKNNLWRYALGLLIIFIFTQIGTIPFVVAIFQKVGLEGAAKISPSNMMTAYMKNDPQYGEFWLLIYNEYKLTKKLILRLSGFDSLMQNEPANKASIQTREKIVLPLITIQQYALKKIKDIENGKHSKKDLALFEKMVTRSLFGNINASRNSA